MFDTENSRLTESSEILKVKAKRDILTCKQKNSQEVEIVEDIIGFIKKRDLK